jgi:hypothetical protein
MCDAVPGRMMRTADFFSGVCVWLLLVGHLVVLSFTGLVVCVLCLVVLLLGRLGSFFVVIGICGFGHHHG